MKKNNRGISIIALVITVIILLMITSIVVFSGSGMIAKSRKKAIDDRLKSICNAIIVHEKELRYMDTVEEKQITAEEYVIMGLDDYADEKNFTPVYVSKKIDENNPNQRIYNLKTLKKKNSDEWYAMEPRIYEISTDNTNSKFEFDVKKGVNRPQIIGSMQPIYPYFDDTDGIAPRNVMNMYTEDWYDYSHATPRWANMEFDDEMYVWIPRFAYKIQDFYLYKDYENVPKSAISIVFLKEDTNYMANGEILPDDFQVHPAFSSNGKELYGIWVAKNTARSPVYEDADSIGDAIQKVSEMYNDNVLIINGSIENHLMKNTEWAAMAYLAFADGAESTWGVTAENAYGIFDTDCETFVAAALGSANKYGHDNEFDIYSYVNGKLTYDSNEDEKAGDALVATSSGLSEISAWYKGMSIMPDNINEYILRRGDISFFAFEAYNGMRSNTCFRNVIIVN